MIPIDGNQDAGPTNQRSSFETGDWRENAEHTVWAQAFRKNVQEKTRCSGRWSSLLWFLLLICGCLTSGVAGLFGIISAVQLHVPDNQEVLAVTPDLKFASCNTNTRVTWSYLTQSSLPFLSSFFMFYVQPVSESLGGLFSSVISQWTDRSPEVKISRAKREFSVQVSLIRHMNQWLAFVYPEGQWHWEEGTGGPYKRCEGTCENEEEGLMKMTTLQHSHEFSLVN